MERIVAGVAVHARAIEPKRVLGSQLTPIATAANFADAGDAADSSMSIRA